MSQDADANKTPVNDEEKDPMSGYASADEMGSANNTNEDTEPTGEPAKDSMSGYASADLIEPEKPTDDR